MQEAAANAMQIGRGAEHRDRFGPEKAAERVWIHCGNLRTGMMIRQRSWLGLLFWHREVLPWRTAVNRGVAIRKNIREPPWFSQFSVE
jgi:hypothetical protein